MPENVYNTTIMFWLQNSLIFLLRWKRSLSFSHFVDHNEILMFAKFYRSDCILEYLNFQNFLGKHAPGPPSFLCLRHSLLALSRRYYTFPVMPQQGKIPGVTPAFLALVSPGEKRVLATTRWETISLMSIFFVQSWFSLLHFCRAKVRGDLGCTGRQWQWASFF